MARCFNVLVHGRITWLPGGSTNAPDPSRPQGFYAHRHVLASSLDVAARKATEEVRKNLERRTGWLSGGLATIDLEAEEVVEAPFWKALVPQNSGHTFYD